jgi:hypothetical protein
MSEQNILNPNAASVYSPDYGYSEGLPQMFAMFQARSGKTFARQLSARGRVFNLEWHNRLKVDCDYLRTWEAQYRNDFFSYQDIERARYFSGRFAAPLEISAGAFDRWNIRGQFIEMPGLPMFAYPSAWGTDSIFLEERDGFGNETAKLTGVWTFAANANAHGGSEETSTNLNTTDAVEILYYGYGFRLYARKANNLGIMQLSSTFQDGTVEVAATNIDLYNAAALASAVLSTQANLKLGFHRVKLLATNTKNAASTAKTIVWDAIEVMQ